ncbi:hypothetical protein Vadar_031576 [Vaccinium darrowii]|uniref:Uncharacterized protein n=1 Tax=Vaccinium darrowii TaxID=229202 RepID=A0ACB7ZN50_9ERIC|nr:hypothetical protein Vadar_031576 [Vaccinium darrowii]
MVRLFHNVDFKARRKQTINGNLSSLELLIYDLQRKIQVANQELLQMAYPNQTVKGDIRGYLQKKKDKILLRPNSFVHFRYEKRNQMNYHNQVINNQSSMDFWPANSSNSALRSFQAPEIVQSKIRNEFPNSLPASVKRMKVLHHSSETTITNGRNGVPSLAQDGMSEEHERIRFAQIGRKKDFTHIERVFGKVTNVLEGLELHTGVFNPDEQQEIVDYVYSLQRQGQSGQLRARTYSEPRKWMRGKGRITIQFGCCYNYAVDRNGNPPGIVRDEDVDPLPPLFKQMIKRMVRWHVLPPTCVPNSCIVNIYEAGDCIPPHIDHHDFVRPFCTVSFLAECNILLGSKLKIVEAGEFSGPVLIPLPIGSVFILQGNGADVAKHCVPSVPAKRISITFRKMDDTKLPYRFATDPELTGIKPLVYPPITKPPEQQQKQPEDNKIADREPARVVAVAAEASNKSVFNEKDDIPATET